MARGLVARLLLRSEETVERDEREQWPSRLSFVLAAMGGAVGIGNLLRYPSQAAAHPGAQWFIPYLIALFFIGIPMLVLEIALGQTHRGGAVVAYTAIHKRLRGLGFGSAYIAFVTVVYYVPIMAYVLVYFRYSFVNPIPWFADNVAFFNGKVNRHVAPVVSATTGWARYPGTRVVGELLGWGALAWLCVYLSIFRGVALTGRVVYFTMLLPLVMCVVLLVRAVTLPRSGEGIRQYIGSWNGSSLGTGDIWSDAVRQIFFSIGTGFGYFIAYASYNRRQSNAVQDALIISLSNSLIEVVMGFAAFAVIGYIRHDLAKKVPSSFDIGFITYPTAIARMPGANAWAVFFFIIVFLLAIDSAFALTEAFITIFADSEWGRRIRKPVIAGVIVFIAFLLHIPYCTQFGYFLIDAIDKWITGITLMFGSFLQCAVLTSAYRYKDVISQTGIIAFAVAQGTYYVSLILGVVLAYAVRPTAGVIFCAVVLLTGLIVAPLISKTPEIAGPLGSNKFINSFWWLTTYSGNQLRRDLNAVVAQGTNWRIPFFWAPVLRWITAPVLIIILGLSYSQFYEKAKDPIHVFAFVVAHIGSLFIVLGLIAPFTFAILLPKSSWQSHQQQYETSPGVTLINEEPQVTHDTVEDSTI